MTIGSESAGGTIILWHDEVSTAEVCRDARGEEAARRDGERTAEVGHARQRAAVEDVEAILFETKRVDLSAKASCNHA